MQIKNFSQLYTELLNSRVYSHNIESSVVREVCNRLDHARDIYKREYDQIKKSLINNAPIENGKASVVFNPLDIYQKNGKPGLLIDFNSNSSLMQLEFQIRKIDSDTLPTIKAEAEIDTTRDADNKCTNGDCSKNGNFSYFKISLSSKKSGGSHFQEESIPINKAPFCSYTCALSTASSILKIEDRDNVQLNGAALIVLSADNLIGYNKVFFSKLHDDEQSLNNLL